MAEFFGALQDIMSEEKGHFYLVVEPFGREITKKDRRKHIIYITDKGTEMRVVMMCWVPSSIPDIVGFAKYSECDSMDFPDE